MLQTPGMHPRDLVAIGQRYMVFKIGDEQLAAICIPFLGSVERLFFIMPLYKAWDVLRGKSVISKGHGVTFGIMDAASRLVQGEQKK